MQQLSGRDALFLHTESNVLPQHTLSVNIYTQATASNGKVTFADIVAHFKKRLPRSAILHQRLVQVPLALDQPYWIEAGDYDLQAHMHHLALPQHADWHALCKLVGQLHATPLDKKQPLWEAYFIEGLDGVAGVPSDSFALVLKVHQSALNGVGGVQLNAALHDLTPAPLDLDCPRPTAPRVDRQPSGVELLGRAYGNSLHKLRKIGGVATQAVPALQRIRAGTKDGTFAPLDDNVRLRFNGKISTSRVVGVRRFDADSVSRIAQSVPGATRSDVMLTIVAGALRLYLQNKNELPEHTLVSGCLFTGSQADEHGQSGQASLINVSLCSDIDNPKQRLAAVQQAMLQSRAFAQALGDRLPVDAADALPAPLFSGLVNLSHRSGMLQALAPTRHTVVSTVAGLQRTLFLAGAQFVTGFNAGPLLPDIGLVHTVTATRPSRQGEIALAFTACPTLLPDPQHYQQCLQSAFDELLVATPQATPKATPKVAQIA